MNTNERAKALCTALAGYTGNLDLLRDGAIKVVATELAAVEKDERERIAAHFDAHPKATFTGGGVAAATRALGR
jgi:hypothetical protein